MRSFRRVLHLEFETAKQKKATPLSVSLRFAAGNLRCSEKAGVRRTRSATLRSDSCGPYPAFSCAPRHSQRGVTRAFASLGLGYPTGHRFARLRSCSLSLWERAGVRALGGGYRRNIGKARCPHPNPLPEGEGTRSRAKRWPEQHCKAERSKGPTHPLWLRRGAQRFADKGSQLFERSEFCETPRNASTAGCPQRSCGSQTVGRLFFGYFLLAKQKKVTRPPGRDPANSLKKKSSQ
jgi:hypothetical protein